MSAGTILVAGALGVVGRAVYELAAAGGSKVIGLSRRAPDFAGGRFVSVDLADRGSCEGTLSALGEVTRLVYAAYSPQPTRAGEVAPNLAMLRNVMTTLERSSPGLRHVTLLQGAKAYGSHLGPFRTPARESDPRHMPPNFYYDQEDFLAGLQRGKSWNWTIFRPTTVYGFSLRSPMNLMTVIAVYGSISKALGLPFRFPGTQAAYGVLRQGVEASLLAEAILWAGEAETARNEIFNITNGDLFRWSAMWPFIGELLGMDVDEPQRIPLAEFMAEKRDLWRALVARHGLQDFPYEDLVDWTFGTLNFDREYDHILDSTKLRKAGFAGFRDSFDMFRLQLEALRAGKVVPP